MSCIKVTVTKAVQPSDTFEEAVMRLLAPQYEELQRQLDVIARSLYLDTMPDTALDLDLWRNALRP
jgi:hypothetical protein